ncbi:MAG: hypothetical protein ACSHXL_04265 [Bacteroidota bacterium]
MRVLLAVLLLFSTFSYSQPKWTELAKYEMNEQSVWHSDILGNLYIADKDVLIKYDTAGVLQYSQSIKSNNRIDAILSINTMKILLFSTQQQSFTIFDNTLSEANKTYDLSDMDFGYVTHLAVSSQPNKIWVYDQLNSKLVLLDLSRSNQMQEIENVRGLLNSMEIQWMKEDGNQLYLFDDTGKLFVFDLYGSLLNRIDFPAIESIEINKNEIFVIKEGEVFRWRSEDNELEAVQGPVSAITDFQWVNSVFFFRTKGKLLKFRMYL